MVRKLKFIAGIVIASLIVQTLITGLIVHPTRTKAAAEGPVLLGTYPVDNANNVPAGASLTLTFDENVVKGTGSAAISIRRVSDNKIVESFIAATSGQVQIHSTNKNVVTVTPSSNTLQAGTSYYVFIDAGAFRNQAGFNYQGIASATAWDFTVVAADTTSPVITNKVPAPGATAPMGTTLQLTFNKTVYASSGNITIHNTVTNDTQVINVLSTSVQGSGTNTITVTPTISLQASSNYSVSVGSGAFQDQFGNSSAEISGWAFRTAAAPMNMPVILPRDNAAGVSLSSPLTMTFEENVNKGTGSIIIKRLSNNSTFQSIDVTASDVSISGKVVTINHTAFETNTGYYVIVEEGTFTSAGSPSVKFQGITDASAWNFSTAIGADSTAPTVTGLKPADNATQNSLSFNLEMTFSEPVYPGSGNIVIKNAANDVALTTIPVTSGHLVGGGINKITINPGVQFVNSNTYYVQIGNQALRDAAGNNFAGINDKTTWNFTVTQDTAAPFITALSPANNATAVALNSSFTATFSEPVVTGTGEVRLKRAGSNVQPVNGAIQIDSNDPLKIRITFPDGSLSRNTAYYIEMGFGSVRDLSGNPFVGILNEYQWTFRTIGSDSTPPSISTSELTSGTKIVLTYNETLDQNSVPSAANFYVTINDAARAVTAVEVSGSTLVLTLQSGVLLGQTVKLSYSKGSSPIQDLSGNAAGSITERLISGSPDSTLPKPVSGSVSGNMVMLVFNEKLAEMNTAGYAQFSANVGGSYRSISSVAVNGTIVMLMLSSPVTDGQAVSISYNPGSYPLRDQSGNAAQAFSSFFVTNSLDLQAPVMQSITASGTNVTVTYNETLDPASIPLTNHYAVIVNNTVGAVSKAEVSGTQVKLTLSTAIAAGNTVQVSYFSGVPALMDMSGNAAAPFSNQLAVTGSATGSGSIAAGIINATVGGQTLTLTFNQSLHSAYVPGITSFNVKIGDSVHNASKVTVSGSTVTLQLARTVEAGETVRVSYIASGTQLRSLNGQLISSFTDYWVQNLSGTSSAALPAYLEVSDLDGITMKTTGAIVNSDVSPAGKRSNRYTLPADNVQTAYNALKSGVSATPRLLITVPESEAAAIVAIPLQQLEDAYKQISNASVAVKHKDAAYEIPLQYLNFTELRHLAGTGTASGHLLIRIDPGTTADSAALINAVNRSQAQIVASPVDYQVSLLNGSKEQPLNNFKGYVTRTVKTPTYLDAAKAAAVWLDPETNLLSYAPTDVQTSNGSSTVTYKRKGNSAYAVIYGAASFNDVEGHWAKKDIVLLSSKMITEGRTRAKFEPNKPITRGEFASYIVRGLGLSGNRQASEKFKDVNLSTTMAAYIGAAAEAGIVLGNTDGTFKPNNPITRQEMAVMMIRAASAAGVKVELMNSQASYLAKFKDRASVAKWAEQDLAKAIDTGVIGGTTGTTLSPKSDATRAQATVMIKRLLVYIDFLDV
ncbi:Ig-like domain-containing protein [Paenibacillus tarimensis]